MRRITNCLILGAFLSTSALAQDGQFTFGVTWRSQSLAFPADGQPAGPQMNEADVLGFGQGSPAVGTLNRPNRVLQGGLLGVSRYTQCLDHQPNTPCGIEVDGFSQGFDPLVGTGFSFGPGLPPMEDIWFSTDEYAMGSSALTTPPNIASEGGGVGDISADIWIVTGLPAGPIGPPPVGVTGPHFGVFDGNGMPSAAGSLYPGIGLIEPNIPFMGGGDNLDSLNIDALLGFPPSGYYTTLDASFPDPLSGANSGTAAAQAIAVAAADVLFVASPAAIPVPFAPASALGLDQMGRGTDDIDALVMRENGSGAYEPSLIPYDWLMGGTDMILFSVRRGSGIIGMPDSIFGRPIAAGDILTAPVAGGNGNPGIFVAAEALGLATVRTDGITFDDDLNALDFATAACIDCNNNGVEDAVDISTGGSADSNGNGIPDECERISEYCYCGAAAAPCGNDNDAAGCGNSATDGAHLYFMGTSSVSADDLVLITDSAPANKFGLFYMGGNQISVPLGDGVRCVGGSTFRYGIMNSGSGGVFVMGPGIVATSCANWIPGCIASGDIWNFQTWYRDPPGPCGNQFNWSNGISVEFVP